MPDTPNQIFDTADGSSSLISGRFGEAYHSRHGAVQESNHVFIEAGFKYKIYEGVDNLKILEIGFGTGLNAYLTFLESKKNSTLSIDYHGLEAYPISKSEYEALNYHEYLEVEQKEFISLHDSLWNKTNALSPSFKLTKHKTTFEDFQSSNRFDLIYFDAFAPSIQAHLWEQPFLTQIYELCNDEAVLVTYCAKGSFKRALKACGFKLESIPGPAKKREMTRAIKTRNA